MKKILSSILIVLGIIFASTFNVSANESFRFNASESKTDYKYGMEHQYYRGEIVHNEVTSPQVYNVVNFELKENNYDIISIDGYKTNGYGMMGLNGMMERFEKENPNVEVIGGINGDFYHINTSGDPINPHIRDYEVIWKGGNNSAAVAIKSDGSLSFEKVVHDGLEVLVINEFGEIKKRLPVKNVNKDVLTDGEVSIVFDNYDKAVLDSLNTTYVKGLDLKPAINQKPDNANANYYTYAKGLVETKLDKTVGDNDFIVISKEIKEVISAGDKIVFQTRIKNFDDVRYAVGLNPNMKLVGNGEVVLNPDKNQHPRTAIGVKANGEVFTIVVDGRNKMDGKYGVTLTQLGHLMKKHGAVEAYNLDGGGSSTLMVGNSTNFEVINELSDKRIRSISNGFLIVKGLSKTSRVTVPENDVRDVFSTPTNLHLDSDNVLHFNQVPNAKAYEIKINDKIIQTSNTSVPLRFYTLGEHKISVRVKSSIDKKASNYSEEITMLNHYQEVSSMLEYLKEFAKTNMGGK
ncbi:phosphodiester glycosidase family protein [Haploplasma modicum]|uniref:phosphodiester glycosidase family protein n=1 Tax=Haploplasma modicum TaxID=2150 RepID=UPI00214C5735|nr:phosphodiester glycosidase family protein [Haploplasma modicum]MCR1809373.1 phosphodiester glycosidase family protein [Haploplasma modicum]